MESGTSVQQMGSGVNRIRYGLPRRRKVRCSRTTSSMSSLTVVVENPPTSITDSRRKSPNAPEMISSASKWLHPARPVKKARAYSRIWNRSIQPRGIRSPVTRPSTITAPFTGLTVPPTATTRSSSRNNRDARRMASASRIESASTAATRGYRAWLRAAAARPLCSPHREVRMAKRPEASPDRRRLEGPPVDPRLLDQGERVHQPAHRPVRGSIGHHDHLELRIVQREKRPDAGNDAPFLVVRGNQDGHGHLQVSLEQVPQGELRELAGVDHDRSEAQVPEQGVEEVEHGEVGQDRELRRDVHVGPEAHAGAFSRETSSGRMT